MASIFDDKYSHFEGFRFGTMDVPFPRRDNPNLEVPCHHATGVTGLITEFEDGNLYAVTGMFRKEDANGLYCHFTAEECRTQAVAFTRMAEFLESGGEL